MKSTIKHNTTENKQIEKYLDKEYINEVNREQEGVNTKWFLPH